MSGEGPESIPTSADPRSKRPTKKRALTPVSAQAHVGSSAGAGSGEFHVYKASRRREYERLRRMDEEVSQERAREEFERKKEERERRDDEKTRRNREKREKAKARKAKAKNGGGGHDAAGKTDAGSSGDKPTGPSAPAVKGVKARADVRKDDEGDAEKKTGDDETETKENGGAPVEEPKGIVIEED
ncbi:hypothetical protein Daesc_003240 [Daldinia eschscholtzii]|uniref:DUF1168 domain protein n=1 Tax=Daldinia eschscholtzii TaxID=292717 RepID=A0AAX6MSI2_9PEZI